MGRFHALISMSNRKLFEGVHWARIRHPGTVPNAVRCHLLSRRMAIDPVPSGAAPMPLVLPTERFPRSTTRSRIVQYSRVPHDAHSPGGWDGKTTG